MGNWFQKGEDKYVITPKKELKEEDFTEDFRRSLETARSLTPSQEFNSPAHSRRVNSLCIKPGEEELFSKQINIDCFDIEKVLGKGAFGKVFLGK